MFNRCYAIRTALKRGSAILPLYRHEDHFDVFWWREGINEVDFIIQEGQSRTALEVKSGRIKNTYGLDAFCAKFPRTQSIVVGSHDAPLEAFLRGDVPLF